MYNKLQKTAFTLAEVLITLGIIGVVAAMTIPNLMTAFAKHRVETQLVKFYSTMNQAMRMSVADNGTPEGWVVSGKSYTYDENVEFLNEYIFPYLKFSSYENCTVAYSSSHTRGVCITNIDGLVWSFYIDDNGGDIVYYADGDYTNISSRNSFGFQFNKKAGSSAYDINSQNFIEPYIFNLSNNTNNVKRVDVMSRCSYSCKACSYKLYCTKLIQLNSWKIPSDYPW